MIETQILEPLDTKRLRAGPDIQHGAFSHVRTLNTNSAADASGQVLPPPGMSSKAERRAEVLRLLKEMLQAEPHPEPAQPDTAGQQELNAPKLEPVEVPPLQRACAALESGRRAQAQHLLEEVVQDDPRSELGWLWLAETVDNEEERRFCLGRVLSINRRNALARRRLKALGPGHTRSPLLRSALTALETGGRSEARRLLEAEVQAVPRSELGWLWLAEAVDGDAERRFCLTQVLSINHRNALARRRLEPLGPGPAQSPLREWKGPPESQPGLRTAAGAPLMQTICDALCGHPVPTTLGYLVALTAAEVITTLIAPRIGLVLHGLLLLALLLHTAVTWGHPSHRLVLSLTFAPLIRILSLSMPLAGFPQVYWYFIVSVPLFVAAFILLRTLGFSRAGIGLNLKALPLQMLVALTGMSLGYIEYRILQPAPLAQRFAWEEIWLPALILLVCTGFAEELIFRGMMQQAVTEALGPIWGIIYVAVLFAVLHVGYQSLFDVLFVFNVALFFGLARTVTGSIVGVSLAHGMTNILLFLTMPLGVNHFDLLAHLLCGP